jgi:hypothetical protein
MMGSRSVEMAAEVEKVRWRRRIGSGEEGLRNILVQQVKR